MKKRLNFNCWNCHRNYSLLRDLAGQPKLTVECPYCHAEGIADLKPYRTDKVEVFKGDSSDSESLGTTLNLPEVIPTSPAET